MNSIPRNSSPRASRPTLSLRELEEKEPEIELEIRKMHIGHRNTGDKKYLEAAERLKDELITVRRQQEEVRLPFGRNEGDVERIQKDIDDAKDQMRRYRWEWKCNNMAESKPLWGRARTTLQVQMMLMRQLVREGYAEHATHNGWELPEKFIASDKWKSKPDI